MDFSDSFGSGRTVVFLPAGSDSSDDPASSPRSKISGGSMTTVFQAHENSQTYKLAPENLRVMRVSEKCLLLTS